MWVRYNTELQIWEASPNDNGVFHSLIENFPQPARFDRYIDFSGYVDSRPRMPETIYVPKRRRYDFDDAGNLFRLDSRTSSEESQPLPSASYAPPVSPSGKGRLYFDGTTFRVSQNGSAYQDLMARALVIGFGGSSLSTGVKAYIEVPFAMKLTGWTLAANASGSLVIDVWKDTYANFPPTVADTITGSEKPTLSAQQINQDLSLTTWTTDLAAGDVLGFNVDSVTTIVQATLTLRGYLK